MLNDSYFSTFPNLESKRLILREFKLSDAVDIHEIRSNELVMKYMDSDHHSSIADSEKFIQKNLKSYQNKEGLYWAIIEKSSGQFIGDFSFWRLDKVNFRGEIGFSLKSNYWRQGFMTEAMKIAIDFGLKNLNLHSLEANINPANSASKMTLTKMGFKKEAYFRENYFYNGKFLDSEIYSLLASDLKTDL